jgi:PH (Pleckstrin Homology) domain-containing protein
MNLSEHDYEPTPGLPAPLPRDETLLWQGAPRWWPLARRAFRVIWVASYFAALALWHGLSTWSLTHHWWATAQAAGLSLLLGSAVVGLLSFVAWGSARATVYSITNRRLVIRHGISLPLTLNLPFSKVLAVDLCAHRDGIGEIAFRLHRQQRIGYILNWPHVRPGCFIQPQPTLRAIDAPEKVAEILGAALLASLREPAGVAKNPTSATAPVRPAVKPLPRGRPTSAAA